jgi:hypothetical protein
MQLPGACRRCDSPSFLHLFFFLSHAKRRAGVLTLPPRGVVVIAGYRQLLSSLTHRTSGAQDRRELVQCEQLPQRRTYPHPNPFHPTMSATATAPHCL